MTKNGYWTYKYDDEHRAFETLDEMWEYIRDNEYYSDELDLERWIDETYSASQIFWKLKDHSDSDSVMLDIMEEYEDDVWNPNHMDDLIEGEDYDYNGFEFTWVDEDEDEEAE